MLSENDPMFNCGEDVDVTNELLRLYKAGKITINQNGNSVGAGIQPQSPMMRSQNDMRNMLNLPASSTSPQFLNTNVPTKLPLRFAAYAPRKEFRLGTCAEYPPLGTKSEIGKSANSENNYESTSSLYDHPETATSSTAGSNSLIPTFNYNEQTLVDNTETAGALTVDTTLSFYDSFRKIAREENYDPKELGAVYTAYTQDDLIVEEVSKDVILKCAEGKLNTLGMSKVRSLQDCENAVNGLGANLNIYNSKIAILEEGFKELKNVNMNIDGVKFNRAAHFTFRGDGKVFKKIVVLNAREVKKFADFDTNCGSIIKYCYTKTMVDPRKARFLTKRTSKRSARSSKTILSNTPTTIWGQFEAFGLLCYDIVLYSLEPMVTYEEFCAKYPRIGAKIAKSAAFKTYKQAADKLQSRIAQKANRVLCYMRDQKPVPCEKYGVTWVQLNDVEKQQFDQTKNAEAAELFEELKQLGYYKESVVGEKSADDEIAIPPDEFEIEEGEGSYDDNLDLDNNLGEELEEELEDEEIGE